VRAGAPRQIGVISDTHGLMRPEALDALRGVDQIIHAGDVGTGDILNQLERIAPVIVVRGNVDVEELPLTAKVELGERKIFVVHIREDLQFDPKVAGYSAVIFGHTHKPLIEEREGVLYLNPGSAGPRRFDLKPSVALLTADAKDCTRRSSRSRSPVQKLDPAPGGRVHAGHGSLGRHH